MTDNPNIIDDVDIKVVPAGGDYTARCNIVIIYNEYEVNNDK